MVKYVGNGINGINYSEILFRIILLRKLLIFHFIFNILIIMVIVNYLLCRSKEREMTSLIIYTQDFIFYGGIIISLIHFELSERFIDFKIKLI